MSTEPELHLILELEQEAALWRRRTMFLLSVVLHAVAVALLLVSPQLFKRGAEMLGIRLQPAPKREATFLWFPPELIQRLKEPPPETNILSDKDRRAQGHSPIVNPFGNRMPYSEGNTPLPEIAGGAPPSPPAAPQAPAGSSTPSPPPEESKEESRLRLMDVPPAGSGGDAQLRVPLSTPGEAIQQSLEAAARGRAGGPGLGSWRFCRPVPELRPQFLNGSAPDPFRHARRGLWALPGQGSVQRAAQLVLHDSGGSTAGAEGARGYHLRDLKGRVGARAASGWFVGLRSVGSGGRGLYSCFQSLSAVAGRIHGQPPRAPVHFPLQPGIWALKRRRRSVRISL